MELVRDGSLKLCFSCYPCDRNTVILVATKRTQMQSLRKQETQGRDEDAGTANAVFSCQCLTAVYSREVARAQSGREPGEKGGVALEIRGGPPGNLKMANKPDIFQKDKKRDP